MSKTKRHTVARSIMLYALLCALSLCDPHALRAQSSVPLTPRQWILTIQANATKTFDDFPDTRFSNGGALTLRHYLQPLKLGTPGALYMQGGIGFHDVQWKTNATMYRYFDTSRLEMYEVNRSFVMPISLSALWRVTIGPQAELFLGAGLEAVYYSPMNANGDALDRPQERYGKWTLGIPLSAEFDYLVSDYLALTVHATMHPTFSDYVDGLSIGDMADAFLTTGIGLAYSFPTRDKDSDFDGLLDRDELHVYRSDPFNPDTDGDGLRDGEELTVGTSPIFPDTDGDGLRDGDEVHVLGSNPLKKDSDGDGLDDFTERQLGTNLVRVDSDSDGLPDNVELSRGTNPLLQDTDGDGLPDGLENTSSPLLRDTDGDGIADAEESARLLRPHDEDFDADGLFDGVEVLLGTDPKKPDTDNDGASDYAEYYGLMTDPRNPDTDGDGILDGNDASPLGKPDVNPVQRVNWMFSEIFIRGNQVDESSKGFLQLLHLLRSAPRSQVSDIDIEVYGKTMSEARERRDQLERLLRKMTGSWDIPSFSIIEDVDSRTYMDARMRYVWNRSLVK